MSANPPAIPDRPRAVPRDDPRNHWCDAPGCDAWGTYGFKFGQVRKWACLAHRARGAAWLARKKAPVPPSAPGDAPAPAQGVLL